MPYVLGKVKRTVAGRPIGDMVDLDKPPTSLTAIDEENDEVLVLDSADSDNIKVVKAKILSSPEEALTTLEDADRVLVRDTSDSTKMKYISVSNLVTYLNDQISGTGTAALYLPPATNREFVPNSAIAAVTLGEAAGGTTPRTYAVSVLPAGITFTVSTRQISGTPTATGVFSVVYTVTDNDSVQAQRTFTITIQYAGRRYISTKANTTITASNLEGGNDYPTLTQELGLPTWTGNRYIIIAQPSAMPDLTFISLGGFGNSLDDFTKSASTVTINGVTYEAWVSDNTVGDVVAEEIIEVRP